MNKLLKHKRRKNIKMHNPVHPGKILREFYMNPLNLTVTETAQALGVTRKTISEIVNCKSGISPKMAIRLGLAFDTSPESWLKMQLEYELFNAKKIFKKSTNNFKVKVLV